MSEFTLVRNLGVVTAYVVTLCLVADVFLLPALLSRFSRREDSEGDSQSPRA
jgi:predicted RND superfamily exporter protein